MALFNTLKEAIDSIGYGLCSLCEAEHEFPDVKCDLMGESDDVETVSWSSSNPTGERGRE